MVLKFVDAQRMAKDNPASFDVPTDSILNGLKLGDSVKVCVKPERFWVTITQISDSLIVNSIDHRLVCSDIHGLKHGDTVRFARCNILDVWSD